MDVTPQWSVVKDVVLFFIAVYGAALSTFNWRQAVKKDRRHISISVSTVMPTYGDRLGNPYARVEAINTGHRVVTIKTIALELPGGERFLFLAPNGIPGVPDTTLPAALSDGQTAFLTISYEAIGTALIGNGRTSNIKLTPVCEDTADNVYRGKPWEVDPQEWVRMSH
jgi:hypothetical protein